MVLKKTTYFGNELALLEGFQLPQIGAQLLTYSRPFLHPSEILYLLLTW